MALSLNFNKVEVANGDRDKTVFASHHCLFRFVRISLGLNIAPRTFQRAMDIMLYSVKWWVALVYLDDIVIFPNSPFDHIDHVRQVLTLLSDAGVTLKLKKC